MLIRKPPNIPPSEITSERNYLDRRRFLCDGAIAAGALLAGPAAAAVIPTGRLATLPDVAKSEFSTTEEPNSFEDISTYNNYYEFGTGKGDPAANSEEFEPQPWSIDVSGHAEKAGTFNLEDFVKPHRLEERIYRMRCVEAWSMVIPWVGIPLADVYPRFKPTSNAKFVAFETLHDPERMPGQGSRVLDWPYREGLTIAEATHPLTILRSAFTARPCRTRTARRFGWWCRGSTASKASRASSACVSSNATAHQLGNRGSARVWLLCEREPGGRPSALEPGARTAHRRGPVRREACRR